MPRVTQGDVARLARTSQATVSLVLNNAAAGRVTPETLERVRAAIRESGYLTARHSRFDPNRIIGVFTYESVFPSVAADFYHPFLVGLERAAESCQFDLLLFTSAPSSDGRRRFLSERRLRQADGCILLGREVGADDLAQLNDLGYPYVSVGRRDDAGGPVPYVGAGYASATRKVVDDAVALGHRRFLYVAHGSTAESLRDRYQGFRQAADHTHPDIVPKRIVGTADIDVQHCADEFNATCILFEEAANGEAYARTCQRSGRRLGSDISLVLLQEPQGRVTGVDFCHFSIPRIEMGRQAIEMLRRMIDAPDRHRHQDFQRLLPISIVSGTTLGPAPT